MINVQVWLRWSSGSGKGAKFLFSDQPEPVSVVKIVDGKVFHGLAISAQVKSVTVLAMVPGLLPTTALAEHVANSSWRFS